MRRPGPLAVVAAALPVLTIMAALLTDTIPGYERRAAR